MINGISSICITAYICYAVTAMDFNGNYYCEHGKTSVSYSQRVQQKYLWQKQRKELHDEQFKQEEMKFSYTHRVQQKYLLQQQEHMMQEQNDLLQQKQLLQHELLQTKIQQGEQMLKEHHELHQQKDLQQEYLLQHNEQQWEAPNMQTAFVVKVVPQEMSHRVSRWMSRDISRGMSREVSRGLSQSMPGNVPRIVSPILPIVPQIGIIVVAHTDVNMKHPMQITECSTSGPMNCTKRESRVAMRHCGKKNKNHNVLHNGGTNKDLMEEKLCKICHGKIMEDGNFEWCKCCRTIFRLAGIWFFRHPNSNTSNPETLKQLSGQTPKPEKKSETNIRSRGKK